MFSSNAAYNQKPRFIFSFCRNFNEKRVLPERLGLDKVDTMFLQVSLTFSFVILEYEHGIENIPLLGDVQGCVFLASNF